VTPADGYSDVESRGISAHPELHLMRLDADTWHIVDETFGATMVGRITATGEDERLRQFWFDEELSRIEGLQGPFASPESALDEFALRYSTTDKDIR
jgi:hypothetical protein